MGIPSNYYYARVVHEYRLLPVRTTTTRGLCVYVYTTNVKTPLGRNCERKSKLVKRLFYVL